jgi:hypothetical protein
MERFPFLGLFIRLATVFAAVVALVGIVQAFQLWELGFWMFLVTLVTAVGSAFMILVLADALDCFRTIEQNTRKGA